MDASLKNRQSERASSRYDFAFSTIHLLPSQEVPELLSFLLPSLVRPLLCSIFQKESCIKPHKSVLPRGKEVVRAGSDRRRQRSLRWGKRHRKELLWKWVTAFLFLCKAWWMQGARDHGEGH